VTCEAKKTQVEKKAAEDDDFKVKSDNKLAGVEGAIQAEHGPAVPYAAAANPVQGPAAPASSKDGKVDGADEKKDPPKDDLSKEFEKSPKFKAIVEKIRSEGIAAEIVDSINFKDLQTNLLEIMAMFLSKPGKSKPYEDIIVVNSMVLWTTAVLEREELVDDFYDWKKAPAEEKDAIKTTSDLILHAIYTPKSSLVRIAFKDKLELVAEKVTKNKSQLPLYYLIKMLTDNMPSSDKTISWESGEFFKLLGALIIQYQTVCNEKSKNLVNTEMSEQEPEFNFNSLLKDAVQRLTLHESTEEANRTYKQDHTLVGLLELTRNLLEVYIATVPYEEFLAFVTTNRFLDVCFFENLFYVPEKTTSVGYNKCKSNEARTQGFKLLLKLVYAFKPREMSNFLENYILYMIRDLEAPKRWKYEPSDKTRPVSSEKMGGSQAGINNLSMICYMISMLQQFYMVPQFRYQLFKAVDKNPENIVEYRERKIDDNMLK
jgi:hypothetical protein